MNYITQLKKIEVCLPRIWANVKDCFKYVAYKRIKTIWDQFDPRLNFLFGKDHKSSLAEDLMNKGMPYLQTLY